MLKIKLNKSTYVMIAFMITTIGNSSFLTARGLDEIVTYFGIGLLLYGIIINRYKNRLKNRKIHKETYSRVFLLGRNTSPKHRIGIKNQTSAHNVLCGGVCSAFR